MVLRPCTGKPVTREAGNRTTRLLSDAIDAGMSIARPERFGVLQLEASRVPALDHDRGQRKLGGPWIWKRTGGRRIFCFARPLCDNLSEF
jgi:hypothetical protein